MVAVVVDASLVIKWLITESDSAQARALLAQWRDDGIDLVAPYLLPAEVTNALLRRIRSGEAVVAGARTILDEYSLLQVTLDEPTDLHHRALEIAAELDHGASYDAHYLALAEVLDAECWTADGRLYRSATERFPQLRLLGGPPA